MVYWVGAFFSTHVPDSDTQSEHRAAYRNARRSVLGAATRLQKTRNAVEALAPSELPFLEGTVSYFDALYRRLEQDSPKTYANIFKTIGARPDVMSYVLMRIFVESAKLTAAEAQVTVARIDQLLLEGSITSVQAGQLRGSKRKRAPSIEKRVSRLVTSDDRALCAPWDRLLQTILGLPIPAHSNVASTSPR